MSSYTRTLVADLTRERCIHATLRQKFKARQTPVAILRPKRYQALQSSCRKKRVALGLPWTNSANAILQPSSLQVFASQANINTASQPASLPASQPASQPTGQPASQPASPQAPQSDSQQDRQTDINTDRLTPAHSAATLACLQSLRMSTEEKCKPFVNKHVVLMKPFVRDTKLDKRHG